MKREKCKFCGMVLTGMPESDIARYSLGRHKLVHCLVQSWCRQRGKEWRIARFKEVAEALGLAHAARPEVSKGDSPVSQPREGKEATRDVA